MKIWVDLANSPQVLFFRPLVPEMRKLGHEITITSRHFAQTVELADHFGLEHFPVGGHGGERIGKIGLTVLDRAWKLIRFAKGQGFDLALSHNSYAQALAAKALGIPFVTSMDYEHQPANHLCFRLAQKVVVPEFFPDSAIKAYGAKNKTRRYHGTKEEIYLSDFEPENRYFEKIGIPSDRIIVVIRPPGTWGLYHNFENHLFYEALGRVVKEENVLVIFLPRVPSQADKVSGLGYQNVLIPSMALDGPNLMYYADIMISGGGTMNREAAVLGTPTYSLFMGKLAAVDWYLMKKGLMEHIDSEDGVRGIPVVKKANNRLKMVRETNSTREILQLMLMG